MFLRPRRGRIVLVLVLGRSVVRQQQTTEDEDENEDEDDLAGYRSIPLRTGGVPLYPHDERALSI